MRPPIRGYDVMLLTKALREQLPPLYGQVEKADDAIAYVKFFDPCRSWTWYATEFDGEDRFFGLIDGSDRVGVTGFRGGENDMADEERESVGSRLASNIREPLQKAIILAVVLTGLAVMIGTMLS